MISQFVDRNPSYILDSKCIFCKIIERKEPAYIVYEDEHVVAFLGERPSSEWWTRLMIMVVDTLPIRPGHTLLVPKAHYPRLIDLPPELGSALGIGLIKIGDAVTKGISYPGMALPAIYQRLSSTN